MPALDSKLRNELETVSPPHSPDARPSSDRPQCGGRECMADARGKGFPAQYPSSPVCSRHDKGAPAFADAPCLAPTKDW